MPVQHGIDCAHTCCIQRSFGGSSLAIGQGADAHTHARGGRTALSQASRTGLVDIVAELLSNKKAYNVVNPGPVFNKQHVKEAHKDAWHRNVDEIRALLDNYLKEHLAAHN